MNSIKLAFRSLSHYLKRDLVVALGVMAATAVLTGALIVGDSMRQSLKSLTLERLGQIDEMLVSDGFFRAKLADELAQCPTFGENYQNVVPAIVFPGGTVDYQPSETVSRAGQVVVMGIQPEFWQLDSGKLKQVLGRPVSAEKLAGDSAIINRALADDLGISEASVESGEATVTVRIPKQMQLPSESALGKKTDLIESLVDLKVVDIVPTEGLGRFGLFPSQADPLNVYVPIELLQESLAYSVLKHKQDPAQANALLVSGKGNAPPKENVAAQLRKELKPTLEDYGLSLKRVTREFEGKPIFDYWSLSSDKLVLTNEASKSIQAAFPNAKPVLTYLANDIKQVDTSAGVPFSMVSAIDIGDDFPLVDVQGKAIERLADDEIVLNEWAAGDLQVDVGDLVDVVYFEPETTHGSQLESSAKFKIVAIAALTEPSRPFSVPRRGPLKLSEFESAPTLANDFDLTPEVPGVTDAQSIKNWDLPFQTADRIRPQDDDYWAYHRTTPKAFVSLNSGRKLWRSRFGETTSYRIPAEAGDREALTRKLLEQISSDDAQLGIHLVSIKRRGLKASSGSTPFDVLFLALSMFVIGAALILVSLLFRLGLQQRAAQVGILKATGFPNKKIRNVWLVEMLMVSAIGAFLGVLLGIGYAWLMIKGLTTWWVDAISRPFLTMHLSSISLVVGLVSGVLICVATIWWSLRRARRQPVSALLHGQLESSGMNLGGQRSRFAWLPILLLVTSIGLTFLATSLAGEAQAGAFMGAGFLLLAALLIWTYRWLKSEQAFRVDQLKISRLALMSAKRNPLRSTLTIGLVAVASFLIAAVSAFRLTPNENGTAGFDFIAQSSQPIFDDLNTRAGQNAALGEEYTLDVDSVVSIRFKPGEDASCNNLYQSTQPRALGVPESFVNRFDQESAIPFAWGGTIGSDDERVRQNPWHLLDGESHAGTKDDPIPVIIDKNTANYSLKIYLPGTVREVQYDTGETFHYKAVGFLANTVLQGSLLMSEADFVNAFPQTPGYRYFLIDAGQGGGADAAFESVSVLEDRLGDQGFDARPADKILANFMAVQNTYLSTFQTLGALGLLLGTFGLAAVQIRSVMERTKELGLLRAVGFTNAKLSRMVLLENVWLLVLGLGVGVTAALITTVPHWLVGSASPPWFELGLMLLAIFVVGIFASALASRQIFKIPLLQSLRI